MSLQIKRALISVSDKTGLKELVTLLDELGVEIISTGGTAKAIATAGVKTKDISDHTGFPEIMDGRVKTLHPLVHGGLLACLDNDTHVSAMQQHQIEAIDLVVVNLYPFEDTVARGASSEETIENIDIGGPSMIRSAAKNHAFTCVVVDPGDYGSLMDELRQHNGQVSEALRKQCAAKAFNRTAAYDAAISQWFAKETEEAFPPQFALIGNRHSTLRYGENPHQQAAFYTFDKAGGIGAATQLQGKELSYNNINDANAALELVSEFQDPTIAIIKHANPCGIASDTRLIDAYARALACDPVSAFGGIIAMNASLDAGLAEALANLFVEVIITPAVDEEAKQLLAKKKNLRVLITDPKNMPKNLPQIRSVTGGFLVQDNDNAVIDDYTLEVVTKTKPTNAQMDDLLFAFKTCKHVKSNAIVLVHNKATIGIGAGQTSRVDSVHIAVNNATNKHEDPSLIDNAVLASDAFFPFPDGLIAAAEAGIKAVIQPGGSKRDEEVIEAANQHGVAMVFTGNRHFRH